MKKNLLGFIAGAAVGAGIGVAANTYFMSEPGKKTKEAVKKMFDDFCSLAEPQIKMVKNLSRSKYKNTEE